VLKKIIFTSIAALMLLFTVISAVKAEPTYVGYPTDYYGYQGYGSRPSYQVGTQYFYYDNDASPWVAGPYPRYYLGNNNYRGTDYDTFAHDDLNHFDEYVGYRDLDVYNNGGGVDILRNPSADIGELELPAGIRVYNSSSYYHVSGMLPGGDVYTKHYYHDHEWELDSYGYGGSNCGYFTPVVAYRVKPVLTHPCQQRSICEKTHSCCN
jgi:hypothetical protein